MLSNNPGPIGVFDSGYGGLTILHGIRQVLPQYDFLYLGDNARAPYGPRSFDVVYEFTRQAEKTEDPDPGRLHIRRGHGDGGADPPCLYA